MVDQKELEDRPSRSSTRNPRQPNPPCDQSHEDPAILPRSPSPLATPPPFLFSSVHKVGPNVGPEQELELLGELGEFGGSGRSSPMFDLLEFDSLRATTAPAMPVSKDVDVIPHVFFEDFATRYRQSQRKLSQRKRLEKRLRATKVSIGVSARLIRIGSTVQRGLVEALKQDDKANFAALYHMLYDLQESCSSTLECDDPDELEHDMNRSSDFFHQLSPQSRSDLLDILRLVRSDPQFLVDRLRSLTPSQLANLTASATTLDPGDPAFPSSYSSSSSSSRPRGQYPFNRTPVQTASFKDHAYAFERTDPLSILLCNVYAAPMEPESPEARLQMETWSSVCAQLMSHGSSRFYPLIGQILSSWVTGSNWKARPKFELYLMDILQTGAFLLEPIDAPAGLEFSTNILDPLRTEVAEEFFASAVDDLFQVLDDPDGGFPCTVLQFAKSVLGKLNNSESRNRFLEYLFLQWFFPKFLYGALTYPETLGLLLDFYICKDARDKLLNQVGLRAYSQVFAVLRSMPNFSILRPSVKERVDNMLSRFDLPSPDPLVPDPSTSSGSTSRHNSSKFLLLSSTDMLTILDALYPTSYSSQHTSPSSVGIHSWSFNITIPYSPRLEPFMEPSVLRFNHNASPRPTSQSGSILSMESLSGSASVPEPVPGKIASRIRFELTDLDEMNERPKLEHPSDEHWAIFSISKEGGGLTWSLLPDWEAGSSELSGIESDDDTQSTTLGLEDNHEALQTAIVRLIKEDHVFDYDDYDRLSRSAQRDPMSLKDRFHRAMDAAHNNFDFVGEHYWWNASQQLRYGRAAEPSPLAPDSWILNPMHHSSVRSLDKSRAVIDRCEQDSVSLDQSLRQLQSQIKELMATVSKVRNKMWYLTDVKNSNRYEEARHVAMALKTMIYSPRSSAAMPDESRSRSGPRSLGGSLFQKPELQVMNMMRAPNSQGGPKKLSDEQVELTRKWLSHNAIENFCKGEERIHRFCYEVRTSITRLVGETMAETPVLWASELFQKERTRYEGYGARSFPGIPMATSTPRHSTTTFEDPPHASHFHSPGSSIPESLSRLSPDIPSLEHKPSIQSLISDSWRPQREVPSIDVSSVGGSPTRAASTSTGDTYSTFWSAPFRHQMYAASVSSAYSRPPSMFSDTGVRHPRRSDRKTQGKTAFIDNLKQTLTSLLLSDLGSPVWSCGSETDAWFSNTIEQNRILMEMQRRAAVQKFYSRYDERAKHLREQRRPAGARRSRSLDAPSLHMRNHLENKTFNSKQEPQSKDNNRPEFSYKEVFYQLLEVFSRHGNPFVKLDALRDLRSLVVASLNSESDSVSSNMAGVRPVSPEAERMRDNRSRTSGLRHSFSERRTPASPQIGTAPATTPEFDARPSHRSEPSDEQIVTALRDLILEVKPKTLFRDLQFISAFVPAEQLNNNTDRGTAFLQFGLAALSLKDEVCHSMVEIADRIVSREFMRRHPPGSEFYPRPSHAIEDAAAMWIITSKEGNAVAQRELAILYLTNPEMLPRVTLPLTRPRDTFKAEMMYRRGKDPKFDPQSMCLALHWMQLSAAGGDMLACNRLREREEFDSIA